MQDHHMILFCLEKEISSDKLCFGTETGYHVREFTYFVSNKMLNKHKISFFSFNYYFSLKCK